uniref:Uncharacterized protein n=1 Tax=Pyramimonas parkeae TaxID=36894 RepID=A0A1D8I1V2_9CHLO|nr:hypothetical protein [Pyramimonas parkeae]AOT98958.1 hypothetical protein [Pyramimonas parkeae]
MNFTNKWKSKRKRLILSRNFEIKMPLIICHADVNISHRIKNNHAIHISFNHLFLNPRNKKVKLVGPNSFSFQNSCLSNKKLYLGIQDNKFFYSRIDFDTYLKPSTYKSIPNLTNLLLLVGI